MLEALEGAFDVSRHGYVAGSGIVVPVQRQAAVARAAPIAADFIKEFERRK